MFALIAGVQLFIWGEVLRTAYRAPQPRPSTDSAPPPVSVIVCFRDAVETLEACVEGILRQNYPAGFELILVDDNSTDGSGQFALSCARQDERVRVLHPGPTRPGKKDALAYGIAQATHEHLLLTDADCTPNSRDWIGLMAERFGGGAELVLGVSPYRARPPGLLSGWQRFESVYVSLKYLGLYRQGYPYMGVGRNIAYTKQFYLNANGFTAHQDLPGGDDDLLVSGTARPERTAAVTEPDAWTVSAPQRTLAGYFRQRARHQSTGVRYPAGVAGALFLIALSQGLFYPLGVYALTQGQVTLVGVAYLARLTFQVRAFFYVEAAGARSLGPPAPNVSSKEQTNRTPAVSPLADIGNGIRLAPRVALYDLLLGPMYLYLALSTLRESTDW